MFHNLHTIAIELALRSSAAPISPVMHWRIRAKKRILKGFFLTLRLPPQEHLPIRAERNRPLQPEGARPNRPDTAEDFLKKRIDVTRYTDTEAISILRDVDLTALTPGQKKQFAENMHALFAQVQTFSDSEERMRMSGVVFFLMSEAGMEDREQYKPRLLQNTRACMDDIAKRFAEKKGETMDVADGEMRKLYEILQFQHTDACEQLVKDRIAALERALNGADLQAQVATRVRRLQERTMMNKHSEQMADRLKCLSVFDSITLKDDVYCLTHKGETWKIENFMYFNNPHIDQVTIRSAKTPAKLITVDLKVLLSALEKNTVGDLLQRANDNYQHEQEAGKKTNLDAYDLPRDQPMVYVRVFPKTYDPVISADLHGSALLASVLRSRYPKLETPPILFTDNPVEDLPKFLETYRGTHKNFGISLYTHGSPEHLSYEKPLTGKDLASLAVDRFPEANFHVETVACYGGGLRNTLQRSLKTEAARKTNLSGRLTAFLPSKPDTVSIGANTKRQNPHIESGAEWTYASHYQLYLMQGLLEGKTYGAAHQEADRRAKQLIYTDPEALYQGELITKVDMAEVRSSAS